MTGQLPYGSHTHNFICKTSRNISHITSSWVIIVLRNLIFAAVTWLAAFLVYVYPLTALNHLITDAPIITNSALIATTVVTALLFYYFRTHATAAWLGGFAHYGLGIGFIGTTITSIGLLTAIVAPEYSATIGMICLVTMIGTSLSAIIQGRRLTLKSLTISSDKIKVDKKLIFISDVHLGSNPKSHLAHICEKINALDYDALLIGGDLFDSSAFQTDDLAPLLSLSKPIYFVTGNHEFYVRDHQTKIASLGDYNIQNIDNKTATLDEVTIIGIGDKQSPATQTDIAKKLVKPHRFNLILVHQPAIWQTLPDEADFMISGHTHNGQIFPFNLLVRLQFKAVYGLYQHKTAQLYVSSGAACWGPRMRLGTKNEIIHLSLCKS